MSKQEDWDAYEKEWDAAEEKGKTVQLTTEIHTWDEEGQIIIGIVKEVSQFTGGIFDTEVNQYLIDTRHGLVSTVLGSATDKQLEETNLTGRKIKIVYRGKKEMKDGKQVNIFDIKVRV